MEYSDSFYQEYADHLKEPQVRSMHDKMFRNFFNIINTTHLLNVIDLGSATEEFYQYAGYAINRYTGVDINKVKPDTMVADYTHPSFLTKIADPAYNSFISIFSSELIFEPKKLYAFYNSIFKKCPNIKYGMVAGFYYKGRETDLQIKEAAGFMPFQTIEHPLHYQSGLFQELRSYVPVPSKMWGPNVVEVWKFLIGKGE